MRIVMFGTGPFAVPSFERLLASQADHVVALVTRPIDDPGQRRKSSPNPMRDAADRFNLRSSTPLPVLAPRDANADAFVSELRSLQADLLVVCDFGQILSADCLATARLGGINLHGSLLPKYRGAAPIHWAIYKGEQRTGVAVIHMTGKLDGGPVLTQAETAIGAEETTETLEPRLAQLGVEPVLEAIEQLRHWDGQQTLGAIQDPAAATHARRLRKEDALLKWQRPARKLVDQIRAFQPWPGTYTLLPRSGGEPLRLLVLRAHAIETPVPAGCEPGQIVQIDSRALHVATGQGLLALEQVQPAGKKPMPIDAFLRGNPLKAGQKLG